MPSHLILWMQIAKQGLPEGLIRFWGTLFVLRPFFDQSALEYLTDSNNQEVSDFKYPTYSDLIYQLKEADKKHKEHQEIVNGSSVRPFYKHPPPFTPPYRFQKLHQFFRMKLQFFLAIPFHWTFSQPRCSGAKFVWLAWNENLLSCLTDQWEFPIIKPMQSYCTP